MYWIISVHMRIGTHQAALGNWITSVLVPVFRSSFLVSHQKFRLATPRYSFKLLYIMVQTLVISLLTQFSQRFRTRRKIQHVCTEPWHHKLCLLSSWMFQYIQPGEGETQLNSNVNGLACWQSYMSCVRRCRLVCDTNSNSGFFRYKAVALWLNTLLPRTTSAQSQTRPQCHLQQTQTPSQSGLPCLTLQPSCTVHLPTHTA